jgi:hypothetical protein
MSVKATTVAQTLKSAGYATGNTYFDPAILHNGVSPTSRPMRRTRR